MVRLHARGADEGSQVGVAFPGDGVVQAVAGHHVTIGQGVTCGRFAGLEINHFHGQGTAGCIGVDVQFLV